MNFQKRGTDVRFSRWLRSVLLVLLVVGVIFRFVNLNHKVYWHDEVYTSFRAAGYTRQEVDQALFQNQILPVKELLRFQQLKPNSDWKDTVRSLAVEDPQHPPLYFLMARAWMHGFGSFPLAVPRSLPAILSLLALPALYVLAWELFASPAVALLAMTLLALSPFDVLFAQVARQYSLFTVMVILSQWLLVRAIRRSREQPEQTSGPASANWQDWAWYMLSVAVGLYTQPLFGLTVIGQAAYVGLEALVSRQRGAATRSLISLGLSVGAALVVYAPWLIVLITNAQRAASTTDWTRVSPGLDYLVKLWVLSFTSLFLDVDFGFQNPVTFLLRAPIVLLIGVAFYVLCRRCQAPVWLCVLTSVLVPFLFLALPDLILGGKRSAVSRYLISCYPGVQLAVAYLLATNLASKPVLNAIRLYPSTLLITSRQVWQGVSVLLVAGSLTSLTLSAASFTWWDKDLSYFNFAIAQRINVLPAPVLISDLGDDFTNTGDLISLSYLLNSEVRVLPIGPDMNWVKSERLDAQLQGSTLLTFRPSQKLRHALEAKYGPLKPLLSEAISLWQVPETSGQSLIRQP